MTRHTVPIYRLPDRKVLPSAARRPAGACLVKIYPAVVSGSLIPLDQDELVFGRDSECSYELADDFASRRHAAIRWRGADCFIEDLGSTNGTFVNDHSVVQRQLVSGDQIRIGTHIFKYLASDHVETQYHEAVFEMMTIDALTQTYNRRYFDDVFEREFRRSRRHQRSLGLLVLDVDFFKQLNDQHGHLIGDELLSALCRRISSSLSKDELFARIGGEEFAIAIAEISKCDLDQFGHSICQAVRQEPFVTTRGELSLTVSVGGSHTADGKTQSKTELFAIADGHLYRAKQSGRNQYVG